MSHCKMFLILTAATVLLVGSTRAAIVKREACARPTQLTEQQITQALDAHNTARSRAGNNDAANMWPLAWDDDLARSAQDRADSCHYEDPYFLYNPITACDGITETRQLFYWQYRVSDTETAAYNVGEIVEKWEEEKQDYDSVRFSCNVKCYNYTQVVWAETKRVGCGIAYCETVTGGSTQRNIVFVCSYRPRGKAEWSEQPYSRGQPCSECLGLDDVGGYRCDNQLCYSCTRNEDGDACKCYDPECSNGGVWDGGKCECLCPADFFGVACEKSCACTDKQENCPSYCFDELLTDYMTEYCEGTCPNLCVRPPSCPKKEVCALSTQLTAQQKTQALNAHNTARGRAGKNGDAANMWPLEWDDDLAKSAQGRADTCHYDNRDPADIADDAPPTACDGFTETGRLFYWQYRVDDTDTEAYNVGEFVEKWEEEKQNYDFDRVTCGAKCKNYTQVVWAETKRVGCGIAYCDSVTGSSNLRNIAFVCSYSPRGNTGWRVQPYIKGTPCSQCQGLDDVGGYGCDNNQLCKSCTPNDDGNACTCNDAECMNGGVWDGGLCECLCTGDFYGKRCEMSCECTDNEYAYCYSIPDDCFKDSTKEYMTENCRETCPNLCVPPPSCPAVPDYY